ncbi:MAG: hypothetical protein AAB319_03535, partial [Pseudomonadota bacterium]
AQQARVARRDEAKRGVDTGGKFEQVVQAFSRWLACRASGSAETLALKRTLEQLRMLKSMCHSL